MKKAIVLLCIFLVNTGFFNSVEAKVKDDSRIVRKIWENKVRYYQFIDNKYLITREGSMDYNVYELNHLSGQLDKIMEIGNIGFRVNFAVDDNQIYIVYQIRDYPQIEQVIECRNLLTGEIVWSRTIEPVTTINTSNGCLYIAKEKLIFLQMGLEEDKYDLVFFDKNQGNILSKVKLDGYNYNVKPLILKDKLIIATTNNGLVFQTERKSWLTKVDLIKMKIVNTIELLGIIRGAFTEEEIVFWHNKIFYINTIVPGEGSAILKVCDNFSRYEKIDSKVDMQTFWKYNNYFIFGGMNGIAKLTKDNQIEYLEYEKYKPYSTFLINDNLIYWPSMSLINLKTNQKKQLSDISPVMHWYYESEKIMVMLVLDADPQGKRKDYYLQGYKLNI